MTKRGKRETAFVLLQADSTPHNSNEQRYLQTNITSTKGLLNLRALPQTVVQIVAEIDSDTVVLFTTTSPSHPPHLHLLRRQSHLPDRQWILLSLGKDRLPRCNNHHSYHRLSRLKTLRKTSAGRGQSATHNIGSRKNELDGTLVDLH